MEGAEKGRWGVGRRLRVPESSSVREREPPEVALNWQKFKFNIYALNT